VGIAFVTLLASFVGLVVWYRTIGRTSASGTAVYQYLVPGVSLVGAAIFLGDRISGLQLVGIVVTLVGVYLARMRPRSRLPGEMRHQ
jgi:O-acetylserine/cysteine efflux transporter